MAQIKYKLANYPEATQHYLDAAASGVISEEDKTDLITNLMACSANDLS
jgi:hypothetical protein